MASTIKDIKSETGLALATISKYLNGGNVRTENREKIEAAIKKLDYRPNEMARALITKKTRTIGVVINDIASQFSGILLRYTGQLLRKHGYSMMICDSAHDPQLEEKNIRFCVDKKVDGILLLPVGMDSGNLSSAKAANVPVVLLDREVPGSGCDCITIDNREAARRAVNELARHGHTRIAVIHSEEYTGNERYLGYLDAMREHDLPIPDDYIYSGPMHSTQLGYRGMEKLMALEEPPTAIMMTNYEVSLGVVMAMNEEGLKCPEDFSLLGFDELTLALVVRPKITVVAQPMEEICQEGVRLLMARVDGETDIPPRRISIYAGIAPGESVREIRTDRTQAG